jgi:hypothetical protein
MGFWEEVDEAIEEVETELRNERREQAMHNCMKRFSVVESPPDVEIHWWRCKISGCPICDKQKGKALKERIQRVLQDGKKLATRDISKRESDKLCRTLGKDNYVRLPVDEFSDFLFYITDVTPRDEVTKENIENFDWTELAKKHCKRNMSGNLGKIFKVVEEEGKYEVECHEIVAQPQSVVVQSYQDVIARWTEAGMFSSMPESINERNAITRSFFNDLSLTIMTNGGLISASYVRTRKVASLNFFPTHKDFPQIDPNFFY